MPFESNYISIAFKKLFFTQIIISIYQVNINSTWKDVSGKGIKEKLKARSTTITRRIVQTLAFLLINYAILEFIFNINLKSFETFVRILPIQASERNPLSKGAGMVEYFFYSLAEGTFPFFIIAVLILIILFTNRSVCGWICPIGTIQDALAAIPTKKKKFKIDTNKTLINLKYMIIILLFIVIIPLGITRYTDILFYFQYKSNIGDLGKKPVSFFSLAEYIFVYFPEKVKAMWEKQNLQPILPKDMTEFWIFFMFFFYLIIILVAIWFPRFYCRYLCPFAAVSAVISEYSFLKLSRSPVKCVGRSACGICEQECPHQIRILDEPFESFSGRGECDLCMRCHERCPYSAISLSFK